MDCKISKDGHLLIKRGEEYKVQGCLRGGGEEVFLCGDWCPAFNEHEEQRAVPGATRNAKIYITRRIVTTCAGIDMELKGDDR